MRLFGLLFLNSANLICRCADFSKHFSESLGLRDNKSTVHCFLFFIYSVSINIDIYVLVLSFLHVYITSNRGINNSNIPSIFDQFYIP